MDPKASCGGKLVPGVPYSRKGLQLTELPNNYYYMHMHVHMHVHVHALHVHDMYYVGGICRWLLGL